MILGATGNMGGAAARELLQRGWTVRAVTRNPGGEMARALSDLGAEVWRADLVDQPCLPDLGVHGLEAGLSCVEGNGLPFPRHDLWVRQVPQASKVNGSGTAEVGEEAEAGV